MCESCKLCSEKFDKMKILVILIFIYLIILTIAQVGAYPTLLNNRPVIDLRRPLSPPPMLPQNRRRSALFPKNNVKFVVNGNSYEKQILSSPLEMTLKPITFNKNVYTRNLQQLIPTESTAAKVSRFTPMPLEDRNSKDYSSIDRGTYKKPPTGKDNDPRFVKSNKSVANYLNYNLSTENVSTVDTPSEMNNINMVEPPYTGIAEKVTISESELYNYNNVKKETLDETTVNAIKAEDFKENESENLTINDLILPKIVEENKATENLDDNYWSEEELIEVLNTENGKDILFPLIEDVEGDEMMISEETATDVTITDELTGEKSRNTRSINVIEEENLGSTVSGFRFTGREPRVNSNQVFRNINS